MRYELKYNADELKAASLPILLANSRGQFSEIFEPRHVNSIYFDWSPFHSFTTHIAGHEMRQKIRVRWYGATNPKSDSIQLESKAKNGEMIDKTVRIIDLKTTFSPDALITNVPELMGSFPSLFVRYYRSYFLSWDKKVRITIDTEIEFRPGEDLNGPEQNVFGIVIEAKFKPQHSQMATQYLTDLGLQRTRFSKYIKGICNLYGLPQI